MRFSVMLAAGLAAYMPAVGPRPHQGDTDAVVDRAVAAYNRAKTARATFEQTITNSLTGSTVTSKGLFEQKQPNLFSFRFTDPKGDLIVSDGKALWLYLPSTNPGQVIKMPLTKKGAGSIDLAGQFFSSPKTRFNIGDAGTATIGSSATHALTLEPKTPSAAPFARAKVWIDDADGTLRQFEVVEPSGLKRLVRIVDYEANAAVQDKSFRFSPPKGARVIDQSALAGG
jgi:outer membrane lipoprotein carrier protein